MRIANKGNPKQFPLLVILSTFAGFSRARSLARSLFRLADGRGRARARLSVNEIEPPD